MNLLYRQIEQAIRNHTLQMSVPKGTTQADVYQSIRSIMRENPDIFWFSHQWKYTEDELTIRFHYTFDKEKGLKAKTLIEDVVQNDFRINEVFLLPTLEKVMYVYKWIALYCKYNIYSAYNQTIYSVFVYRNSVCTGYAKAVQYLFKVLGIESKLVFGTMHNAEKGSRHCWLVVKIDGLWYHIDPTFAVPEINDLLIKARVQPVFGENGLVYNYFCCNTKTIKQSRVIEDEEELPECNYSIDYKVLQNLPIKRHRNDGAESQGVRDSVRVRDFALAYKAQGVDYFFDRDKLGAGDVFEEKIVEYIDSADLFILCWSANAANSEYVGRERRRAMLRAYPQLSHHEATLKIYPISIEPRTELPQDMAGIYNFEEV